MSVIVLVNISAKEDSLEELKKYFKEILPDTRSYEGCQGVHLYENQETPTKLTIHAKWTSEEAQKKYMAWRIETGELDKLTPMLSEPPSMQFYNIVDE
ncbi:MAG: antibiotic biosynthesis monooxygenase [Nitrosopumilus sp.]|nr:antibiotic biosynthesis monooxygenase [Nitrosopumilus sp.]